MRFFNQRHGCIRDRGEYVGSMGAYDDRQTRKISARGTHFATRKPKVKYNPRSHPWEIRAPSRGLVSIKRVEGFFERPSIWHEHSHWQILLMIDAGMQLSFRGESSITLPPGTAALIPPGLPHRAGPAGVDRRISLIDLMVAEEPENDLHRWLASLGRRELPCRRESISRCENQLRQMTRHPAPVEWAELHHAVWGLLIHDAAAGLPQPTAPIAVAETSDASIDQRILYIETQMRNRLAKPYDGEVFAGLVSLSVSQLTRLFRQERGCTPLVRLQRLRLEHAVQYLAYSSASIKEISALCGFASPTHFGRLFRKHHGVSPTEFRADPDAHAAER